MDKKTDVPKTFAAKPKGTRELDAVLKELDAIVDQIFLEELQPAISRARAALGLEKQ